MRAALAIAVAAATWLGAHGASAQDEEERARVLFEAGLAAFDQGDLPRAEQLFRGSLSLRTSGSVMFNLGTVLEQVGRLREAHALFTQVVNEPAAPEGVRNAAQQHIEGLAPRLARLTFVGAPPGSEVRIDGELVPGFGPHAVDPGPHQVTVRLGSTVLLDRRVQVGEREQAEVAVDASLVPEPVPDVAPVAPPPIIVERGSDDTWVWVLLSVVGALLVGGGIALGVHLGTQPSCSNDVVMGCLRAGF